MKLWYNISIRWHRQRAASPRSGYRNNRLWLGAGRLFLFADGDDAKDDHTKSKEPFIGDHSIDPPSV